MGVRGLLSFLKPYGSRLTFDALCAMPPQRIGIDISYYLYKWQADKAKILDFLSKLQSAGHRILLVFDGKAEDAKQSESKRRKEVRNEELKSASAILELLNATGSDLSEEQRTFLLKVANEHERRGWQLTREIRHEVKNFLYEAKIPLMKAVGEADSLLTALAVEGNLNLVISGDMDLVVLGTPQQLVPQGDGYEFVHFHRKQILGSLRIYDDQFRTFCAMCSSEYGTASGTLDIRKAYCGIRVYGNMSKLKNAHGDWLEEWPPQNHCFFRDHAKSAPFVREDERDRLEAFLNDMPMPYYSKKRKASSCDDENVVSSLTSSETPCVS